ncbi:MAG: hypothetical protein AAB864_01665 [Patescibacteria group bacterium]
MSLSPKKESENVLIWSGEHRAYWSPNHAGYTDSACHAGRYDRKEAERILAGCGPEKELAIREDSITCECTVHTLELVRLRAQLAPSPCGHRMADCSCTTTGLPHSDAYDECRACARETRLLEDLRERCTDAVTVERDDFDEGTSEWCASQAIVNVVAAFALRREP